MQSGTEYKVIKIETTHKSKNKFQALKPGETMLVLYVEPKHKHKHHSSLDTSSAKLQRARASASQESSPTLPSYDRISQIPRHHIYTPIHSYKQHTLLE